MSSFGGGGRLTHLDGNDEPCLPGQSPGRRACRCVYDDDGAAWFSLVVCVVVCCRI